VRSMMISLYYLIKWSDCVDLIPLIKEDSPEKDHAPSDGRLKLNRERSIFMRNSVSDQSVSLHFPETDTQPFAMKRSSKLSLS
jgi:hypothetical protein